MLTTSSSKRPILLTRKWMVLCLLLTFEVFLLRLARAGELVLAECLIVGTKTVSSANCRLYMTYCC